MRTFILFIIASFPLFSFSSTGPIIGFGSVCVGAIDTLSDTTSGGMWSSNAAGVATVGSLTGIVTGVTAGTATITYSTGSGYVTTTVTVIATVTPSGCITETHPAPGAAGIPDTFIATSMNGGTRPDYFWSVNGINEAVGDTFSYPPLNGDLVIVCILSNAACASIHPFCTDTLCSTGTTDVASVFDESYIELYPNPVFDVLKVNYQFNEDGIIQLVDVSGHLVVSKYLSAARTDEVIDLTGILPGIYLYRILQANLPVSAGRIIKR